MAVAKPKLEPDVEAFYNQLLEKGNLNEAETDLLNSLLGKAEVQTEFKSGIHARRRFDQEMDKSKKAQKDFEAEYNRKLSELDSLRETFSSGEILSKKEKDTLLAKIQSRDNQLKSMVQKAKEFEDGEEVLRKLGLDPSSISTEPIVPTEKSISSQTPSFTKEDLMKEVQGALSKDAQFLAKLPFDLMKFSREYFSLTGKELDPDEFLEKIVSSKSGDYNKVYLEEYDIPNLREKKKEETLRATLQKEFDEKWEKEKSQLLLPSEQRANQTSDFFKAIQSDLPIEEKQDYSNSPLGVGDRQATVNEAVQEFAKLRAKRESASA